jgi:hypothetical protein
MEIKFLTDEEMAKTVRKGRNRAHEWDPFIEELKRNPNKWAEFYDKVNYPAQGYRVATLYKGVEVKVTGGNHLNITDPAKVKWTVFLRYVPQKDI